jgi:glycosyltransferase involved in cell wall biosynthesis
MRIALATSSFPLDPADGRAAAGLFVADFARLLAELGHRVTVVTPDKRPGAKRSPEGIEVRWFPWAGGERPLSTLRPDRPGDWREIVSAARAGSRALEQVASEGIDHVLAMWAVPAGYWAHRLKRRTGIPYTTWCLGSDLWTWSRYPFARGLVVRVLRASDLVYADGQDLARDAERLSGRRCDFLPSGRRSRRREAALPEPDRDHPRFLFVGRYAKVKGLDVLLEAMARYRAKGGLGRLDAFGGGPLEPVLRARCARSDLAGVVKIGGYADEETVIVHLETCDALVVPSRLESIPVILNDAARCAAPLVVSDVGDMGRIVSEHEAGVVVPPADPERLAAALAEVVSAGRARYAAGLAAVARLLDPVRAAERWSRDAEETVRRTAAEAGSKHVPATYGLRGRVRRHLVSALVTAYALTLLLGAIAEWGGWRHVLSWPLYR